MSAKDPQLTHPRRVEVGAAAAASAAGFLLFHGVDFSPRAQERLAHAAQAVGKVRTHRGRT